MAKSGGAEDFGLENTEFDVVVIGTSMVQSLLAGTLAASGKKVLHLDSNSFYGGRYNTFTLGSLASFLSPPEPETDDEKDDAAPTPAPEAAAEAGGASASGEQQQQQEKPKKPKKKIEKEESSNLRVRVKKIFPSGNREEAFVWASAAQFRSFNIDYTPKVLWCTGDLVDVLIATSVTRYLEFHAIQQSFLYLSSSNSSPSPSNLQLVPCSKGEIFKSKLLSLTEKRRLMKFIQLCSVDPVSNPEVFPYLEKPFSEFVRSQKLPPTLESFILYAIGLINEPFESVSIDTIEGLQRLENYLGSLGRYGGSSPFLYPAYGTSELAQAFCRLCAVHGGTYMLRLATKELLFEDDQDGKKKIVGLVTDEGQTFKSSWFVMDKEEAFSNLAKSGVTAAAEASKDELLELGTARAVIITNSKLVPHKASGGTEEEQQAINNVFFVIPPHSQGIDNPHAIHALQLGWGLSVAPRNHYLIHLSTQSSEGAEDALQRAIDVLFRPKTPSPASATPSEKAEDLRPEALWYAIFTQWTQTAAPLPSRVEESLPSNLLYFSDRSSLISGFESELQDVMRLYNKIVGPEGEPFPPKIDPDEGVYAGGGDEDEEPKPSTLVQPTASSEPAPNASAVTEEAEEGSQAEQQEGTPEASTSS